MATRSTEQGRTRADSFCIPLGGTARLGCSGVYVVRPFVFELRRGRFRGWRKGTAHSSGLRFGCRPVSASSKQNRRSESAYKVEYGFIRVNRNPLIFWDDRRL